MNVNAAAFNCYSHVWRVNYPTSVLLRIKFVVISMYETK